MCRHVGEGVHVIQGGCQGTCNIEARHVIEVLMLSGSGSLHKITRRHRGDVGYLYCPRNSYICIVDEINCKNFLQ
jgi:hypothetical protein